MKNLYLINTKPSTTKPVNNQGLNGVMCDEDKGDL
jgi:hypothetical protein